VREKKRDRERKVFSDRPFSPPNCDAVKRVNGAVEKREEEAAAHRRQKKKHREEATRGKSARLKARWRASDELVACFFCPVMLFWGVVLALPRCCWRPFRGRIVPFLSTKVCFLVSTRARTDGKGRVRGERPAKRARGCDGERILPEKKKRRKQAKQERERERESDSRLRFRSPLRARRSLFGTKTSTRNTGKNNPSLTWESHEAGPAAAHCGGGSRMKKVGCRRRFRR
jgi:hypothetical protein